MIKRGKLVLRPTFNSNLIPEMVREPVEQKPGLWPVVVVLLMFWGLVGLAVWYAALQIL